MDADETADPLGFADVRVLRRAEQARLEQERFLSHANGRSLPGRVRTSDKPRGLIFRPPYWMVIADTGE